MTGGAHPRAALALVALLAGCGGTPELRVARVVVPETPATARLANVGVEREALRATATRLLEQRGGSAVAAWVRRRAASELAQVLVRQAEVVMPEQAVMPEVQLELEIELAGRGGPTRRAIARADSPISLEPGSLKRAVQAAVDDALERAVDGLALAVSAERKGRAALLADLRDASPAVRAQALQTLADRGDRAALPEFARALEDPSPEVSERAVGALAQLRDPRAVPALVERARHRDATYVASVARILGDLGGPEARAWLVTTAEGHPDPEVRAAAREALASLPRER